MNKNPITDHIFRASISYQKNMHDEWATIFLLISQPIIELLGHKKNTICRDKAMKSGMFWHVLCVFLFYPASLSPLIKLSLSNWIVPHSP